MNTDFAQAARYVAHFEGFAPYAKWDVNAWRIGYGSDTRTAAQIPVNQGDTETVQDALANLAVRLPKFEATIIAQVGANVWSDAPQCVKIALLSFAYNYGELTPTLAASVKQKMPWAVVSFDVAARQTDNAAINRTRRLTEAGTILAAI